MQDGRMLGLLIFLIIKAGISLPYQHLIISLVQRLQRQLLDQYHRPITHVPLINSVARDQSHSASLATDFIFSWQVLPTLGYQLHTEFPRILPPISISIERISGIRYLGVG